MKRALYFAAILSVLPLACQSNDPVPSPDPSGFSPLPANGRADSSAHDLLQAPAPAPLFTQSPSSLNSVQPAERSPQSSGELGTKSSAAAATRAEPISWSGAALERASTSGGERGVEAVASTPAQEAAVPALDRVPRDSRIVNVDGVEELFIENLDELRSVLRRVDRGETLDNFDLLRKVDAEKRLIALFFLRHERNLKEFRELVDSLSKDSSGILALEILKAAFYEELGLDDLRDQALKESTSHIQGRKSTPHPGSFEVVGLTFASNIGGYRNVIRLDPAVFKSGQETLLYGEFENFINAKVVGNTEAQRYRRSFTAHATLRDSDGKLVVRQSLLTADQFVGNENEPSHFWSNFRIPGNLRPGDYTLEVLAVDLEAHVLTTTGIDFTVEI